MRQLSNQLTVVRDGHNRMPRWRFLPSLFSDIQEVYKDSSHGASKIAGSAWLLEGGF